MTTPRINRLRRGKNSNRMSTVRFNPFVHNPIKPSGDEPDSPPDANMTTQQITDDLDLLLAILPERIRTALQNESRLAELIEVVMDLGRLPEARFSSGESYLSSLEVTAADLHARYADVPGADLEKITTVHILAGRVMTMRQMGKASFLTIRDASSKDIQIYVKLDRVGEAAYQLLKLTDLGDIVGVAGSPMRTKTGELSIAADGFRVPPIGA